MICVCLDFKNCTCYRESDIDKNVFKSICVAFSFLQHGSDSENDLWDDTALIKAYDNAISLVKVRFITYWHRLLNCMWFWPI